MHADAARIQQHADARQTLDAHITARHTSALLCSLDVQRMRHMCTHRCVVKHACSSAAIRDTIVGARQDAHVLRLMDCTRSWAAHRLHMLMGCARSWAAHAHAHVKVRDASYHVYVVRHACSSAHVTSSTCDGRAACR
eukprot:101347-Chlamydomonas_euryale.AAC.1